MRISYALRGIGRARAPCPGRGSGARFDEGGEVAAGVRYAGLTFDPDFRSVRNEEGETVNFTRAERRLLVKLAGNAGVVVSRERLLDAVSGEGSDVSDRNIDFIINRLRRKLGDQARNPAFIATRYGEGYVWVAEPGAPTSRRSAGAFMVVGPVRGLSGNDRLVATGREFADRLVGQLESRTMPGNRIALDADCPGPAAFGEVPPRFGLALSFLATESDRLDCTLTLRTFATGRILLVTRKTVAGEEAAGPARIAEKLAGALIDGLWHALSRLEDDQESPEDGPLSVHLHAAADALNEVRAGTGWQNNEQRLRRALAETPDNPRTKLMLATVLHTKYVISGADILAVSDPRRADEAEIESLITSALPELHSNGVFSLAAAKLLYFANDAYRKLAFDLANEVFGVTTAFGSAYATLAQFRAWRGEIDDALDMYDRAIELAEPGSFFHFYLLTLKAQALTVGGDPGSASETVAPICRVSPAALASYAMIYEPPRGMDAAGVLEEALDAYSFERARALVLFHHYVAARLFVRPEHRRNVMRRSATVIAARFGPDAIPQEVRPDLPEEFLAPAG